MKAKWNVNEDDINILISMFIPSGIERNLPAVNLTAVKLLNMVV